MKPINKKEIKKFQKKYSTDKLLWLNLWKRMREHNILYEDSISSENWNKIYIEHFSP